MMSLNTTTSFIGRDWMKTVDDNWPNFLAVWKPIIQFADDNGVRIAIENCPMKFTKDKIPAATLAKVDDFKKKILSGEIKVWNAVEQGYPDYFK